MLCCHKFIEKKEKYTLVVIDEVTYVCVWVQSHLVWKIWQLSH